MELPLEPAIIPSTYVTLKMHIYALYFHIVYGTLSYIVDGNLSALFLLVFRASLIP